MQIEGRMDECDEHQPYDGDEDEAFAQRHLSSGSIGLSEARSS
jgi:hypothetical protein